MNLVLQYPESAIKILMLFFISLILGYNADKKNNYRQYLLVVVILSFFIGLRSFYTGTDTFGYAEDIRRFNLSNVFLYHSEYGYVLFSYLLYNLFHSETIVFLAFASATMYFFLSRFWELRKNYDLTILLLGFLSSYYLMSANIIRQLFAMSIVFWATRYLYDKDKDKPLIFILIVICTAFLFHTTAIVGIGLFVIDNLFKLKEFSIKRLVVPVLGLVFTTFYINYTMDNSSKFTSLSRYISNDNRQSGQSSFYSLVAFSMFFILSLVLTKKDKYIKENHLGNSIACKDIVFNYFCGYFLSYYYSYYSNASRISFYFTMFVIMFYSYKWDNKIVIILKRIFWIVYSIKMIFDILNKGYYGVMPYRFIWND